MTADSWDEGKLKLDFWAWSMVPTQSHQPDLAACSCVDWLMNLAKQTNQPKNKMVSFYEIWKICPYSGKKLWCNHSLQFHFSLVFWCVSVRKQVDILASSCRFAARSCKFLVQTSPAGTRTMAPSTRFCTIHFPHNTHSLRRTTNAYVWLKDVIYFRGLYFLGFIKNYTL